MSPFRISQEPCESHCESRPNVQRHWGWGAFQATATATSLEGVPVTVSIQYFVLDKAVTVRFQSPIRVRSIPRSFATRLLNHSQNAHVESNGSFPVTGPLWAPGGPRAETIRTVRRVMKHLPERLVSHRGFPLSRMERERKSPNRPFSICQKNTLLLEFYHESHADAGPLCLQT